MCCILQTEKLLKKVRRDGKDIVVIDRVDLQIRAGDFVLLKGKNGSGKTTLAHIFLGLRRITAGKLTLFGYPPNHSESRLKVGAMLQKTKAPNNITVEELINLVRGYYPNPRPTQELLQCCNLTNLRRSWASELSGGQEQFLYFALAMAGDPEFFIFDEPTAFLSEESKAEFLGQIRALSESGKTCLLITHEKEPNLNSISHLFTQKIILESGKLRKS